MTQIFKINPRKESNIWLFDDPSRELDREPFVMGADAMIEALADQAGACRYQKSIGVPIYFSAEPFSINSFAATEFTRSRFGVEPEAIQAGACGEDGAWYQGTVGNVDFEGWLCPATLKYFPVHPPKLYALVDRDAIKRFVRPPNAEYWMERSESLKELFKSVSRDHGAMPPFDEIKHGSGALSDAARFAERFRDKQRLG